MRLGLLVLWLCPAVALAQTPCSLANYGPNDGGWIGPVTRVACTCSDCPLVRVEARLVTGAYGDSNSIDVTTPNSSNPTYATFTHLADYAWRATPIQGDGGALPTSLEGFARADSRAPTDPVLQQVLVDGGLFSLVFTPSTDDGIGVDDYKGRLASADEPTVIAFAAGTGGSPLASFMGPGDWMIGLYAKDRVDNLSALVWWPTSFHTFASGPVSPPQAPLLTTSRYTNNGNLAVQLTASGEEFQFRLMRLDGGVHVIFPTSLSQGASTIAYGFTPLEGEFLISASQRVGTAVSDWSAGTPVGVDHTNPSAPGTLSGMQVGADVVLSWGPASDNLGVSTYVVQRSDGPTLATPGLTVTDVAPALGPYDYVVSAVDLSGNRGPSSNSITVVVVAFDAGVASDAGAALDAGVSDSGTVVDAGSTSVDAGVDSGRYAVGCGCAEVDGSAVLVAALVSLSRRRRKPEPS